MKHLLLSMLSAATMIACGGGDPIDSSTSSENIPLRADGRKEASTYRVVGARKTVLLKDAETGGTGYIFHVYIGEDGSKSFYDASTGQFVRTLWEKFTPDGWKVTIYDRSLGWNYALVNGNDVFWMSLTWNGITAKNLYLTDEMIDYFADEVTDLPSFHNYEFPVRPSITFWTSGSTPLGPSDLPVNFERDLGLSVIPY